MLTIENFKEYYHQLGGTKNILIGFSGGLDSTVLLELCSQAFSVPEYTIAACHINHNLQTEADLWVKHCIQICQFKNIPFILKEITQPLTHNIEETARNLRLKIFQDLLRPGYTLILAHHANDQTETILQRICRGTGILGLQGMLPATKFAKGLLIRPLLKFTRTKIYEFAKLHHLKWIEDPSNNNIRFTRNLLRTQIIPLLQTAWPQCVHNINRLGELAGQSIAIEEQTLQQELSSLQGTKSNTLNIDRLICIPFEHLALILRFWLKDFGLRSPSRKKLTLIIEEVLLATKPNIAQIKISNYWIRRYRHDLYVLTNMPTTYTWEQILSSQAQTILLPNGKTLTMCINAPNMPVKLVLGSRGNKAKKIFQQHNIPTWERSQYVLVFISDPISDKSQIQLTSTLCLEHLVQIIDLWQDAKYQNKICFNYS